MAPQRRISPKDTEDQIESVVELEEIADMDDAISLNVFFSDLTLAFPNPGPYDAYLDGTDTETASMDCLSSEEDDDDDDMSEDDGPPPMQMQEVAPENGGSDNNNNIPGWQASVGGSLGSALANFFDQVGMDQSHSMENLHLNQVETNQPRSQSMDNLHLDQAGMDQSHSQSMENLHQPAQEPHQDEVIMNMWIHVSRARPLAPVYEISSEEEEDNEDEANA